MVSDIKFSKKAIEMGWLTTEQLKLCLKKQKQLWEEGKSVSLQKCTAIENILNEKQISIIEENCQTTNVSASLVKKKLQKPRHRSKTIPQQSKKITKKKMPSKKAIQPIIDLQKAGKELPEAMGNSFRQKIESSEELPETMGNSFRQKIKNSEELPKAMGNSFRQKIENSEELPKAMGNSFRQKIESSEELPKAMGNSFRQKIGNSEELPETMGNSFQQKVNKNKPLSETADNPFKPKIDSGEKPPKPQNETKKNPHREGTSPKQQYASKNNPVEVKSIEIGGMFAHYRIEKLLGQGGMGIVYKAIDRKLNRTVALKVLSAQNIQKKSIQRFKQEALATAQLDHPNIVKIFDVGSIPQDYFTMEYVEGDTLDFYIEKKKIDYFTCAKIVKLVANALQEAHKKNIIHRDIKPANVLIDRSGQPKIMDFGLAKFMSSQEVLTKRGSILGTPNYMAPEQFKGEKIDKRADIYSLGATLYEMITYCRLFDGQSPMSIAADIFTTRPKSPRAIRPDIPQKLENICLKALEKNVRKRYLNANLFEQDLNNFINNSPTSFDKPSRIKKIARFISTKRHIFVVCILSIIFLYFYTQQNYYYQNQLQIHKKQTNQLLQQNLEILHKAIASKGKTNFTSHALKGINIFNKIEKQVTSKFKNQIEILSEYVFVENDADLKQGEKFLQKFIRSKPSAHFYIIQGIINEKLAALSQKQSEIKQKYDNAAFYYQEAIKLDSKYTRAYLLNGNLYAKQAFLLLQKQKNRPNIRQITKRYQNAVLNWKKMDRLLYLKENKMQKMKIEKIQELIHHLRSRKIITQEHKIYKYVENIDKYMREEWKE